MYLTTQMQAVDSTKPTYPLFLIGNNSSEPASLQLAQNPRADNLPLITPSLEENLHNSFHAMDRIIPVPLAQHALTLELSRLLVAGETHVFSIRACNPRTGDFTIIVEVLRQNLPGLREDEVRVRVAAEVGDGVEDAVVQLDGAFGRRRRGGWG
jgi:hypothetical protein